MGKKFITLRVWHEGCWMLDACERHRDVRVESHGISAHEGHVRVQVGVQAPDASTLGHVLARALPEDVHREVLHQRVTEAEVFSHYPAKRSLFTRVQENGLLIVSPIVHAGGHERWEILGDSATLNAALESLREVAEVRVERIADTRADEPRGDLAGSLASSLSPRQREILSRAVDEGYYDWPRGKNVTRMAADLGISAPTCLEHIRRAESRVVPALVDEMRRRRP